MRAGRHHGLGAWLMALAVVAAVQGCRTPDTVVKVTVTGNVPGLRQLHVVVRGGGETTSFDAPPEPMAIVLPTGLTLQVRRSITGRLDVDIEGRDASGTKLASGTGFIDDLEAGALYALTVDLGGVMTDAGADSGTDAGPDGGVDGGADSGAEAGGDVVDDVIEEDAAPDVDEDAGPEVGEDTGDDLGDDMPMSMDAGDDLPMSMDAADDVASDVASEPVAESSEEAATEAAVETTTDANDESGGAG